MLDQLVIGTAQPPDPLRHRLEQELAAFTPCALAAGAQPPQLSEHRRGAWAFLVLRWPPAATRPRSSPRGRGAAAGAEAPDADPLRRDWRGRLVRVLTAYIHEEHRWNLMQRLMTRRYGHLAPDERLSALEYARRQLAAGPREGELRHLLARRLDAYLAGAALVLVEGFLRFRCREYVEALELAVDRAVDEYLLDREYRDFVRLLRQFVDVQVPRLDVVHVLVEPSGAFRLVDDAGHAVPVPADGVGTGGAGGAGPGGEGGAADPEDVLLSALITVGARRFVLHLPGSRTRLRDDTRETLEQVFGSRVEHCPGCPRCRRRSRRPVTPAP